MLKRNQIFVFPVLLLTIITGINIYLQTLPLTNVLHYEFSAINGIIQSLFGGLISIYFINKNSLKKEIQFNVFKSNFRFLFLFTFSQFLLALIFNVFAQICPLSEGLLFYFVITIPSFFIGIIIGIFAFSISGRYSILIFISIWLLVLLAPISELYSNPQLYFYNPFIGFSPGTIYDEDITITFPLILYRIMNIIFFLFVFYLVIDKRLYKIEFHKTIRVLVIVISVLSFSLLKPSLGFSTDLSRMQKELKNIIETDHFLIFYSEDFTKSQKDDLILNHEYAYEVLKNELKDEPDTKIFSFLFKDGAQKGELFGSKNADVAKPWLNQIYLNYSNYSATLQHEIAHLFSANYGITIFKIADNFNPVLIEGFATSLANNYDDNDIHFMAGLAYNSGYNISISSLFTGFNFFGQTSSISYIYAGSFIKYLSEFYGISKTKELYGNLDFESILNKKIEELETEYYEFLLSKNFIYNKNTADLYFGRKPIFKRFCARFVANEIKKGFEYYNSEKFFEAEQVFSDIYNVSDSYQSLAGKSNSLIKLNRINDALNFINNEIKKFEGTSYFFNLEILLGDLFVRNKEFNKADSIYSVLMEQNPKPVYKNLAFFRKILLHENDSLLVKYLEAEPDNKLTIIKEILLETNDPQIVPFYLNLSEKENYNERKNFITGLGEHAVSANSLFGISKTASLNNDYNYAVNCLNIALKLEINENKKIIYNEYLKKYKWFHKFGTDVLSNSTITN